MALDGYWCTGPAIISTSTGTAGAFETLGITENGAEVEITKNYKELFTDVMGEMTPQELQHMGEVAVVTAPLIITDRTVLAKVLGRGNRASVGQLNTPGRFVGANGDHMSVGISGPYDFPYVFSAAVVRPARFPMSVSAKPFTITFYCWPYLAFTATVAINTYLYARAFP